MAQLAPAFAGSDGGGIDYDYEHEHEHDYEQEHEHETHRLESLCHGRICPL
jgi:hypothetical protein